MASKVIRNITKVFRSASGVLFGRVTAGTGRGEELSPSAVRSLLSVSTTAQTAALLAEKADLVGGVIPSSQIPAIAISEYLGTAANQSAMLAFVGDRGDWCLRSDTGTTFVLSDDDSTLLASWVELNYPTAPVTSVNGETGAVTLSASDVGAAATSHTHTQSDITNLTTDLAAKAAAATTIAAGTGLTGGGDLSANRTISLANTAVSAGSYTAANITVDAQGRLTSAANGSAGGSTPKGFRAVSGHYYHAHGLVSFGTAVTITANTLYLVPFRFRTSETWSKIFTYVNSAASGGNLRLGIWCPVDSGDGHSATDFTLVLDCGTVSLASTGFKEITGLSVAIDANKIYCLSLLSDQTWTALGASVSLANMQGADWLTFGMDSSFNFYLTSQFRKTSVTYGPLASSVSGMTLLGTNTPGIGLRL